MSLRVNNNITALIAHRNLTVVDFQLQKSIERLSSGLRINRASDDPSNFITSEQMRTQIEGITQAITNTVDAISMIQTAEGAFDEIESLVRSMRTLALHAANTGPNDTSAIANDQVQIQSAIDSLNNIASTRKYGSKVLLDGSLGRGGSMAASAASLSNVWNMGYSFMRVDSDTTINADFEVRPSVGCLMYGTIRVVTTNSNLARHSIIQSVATFADGSMTINVDETLTINGITVNLTAGMSNIAVRDAINAVAAQTGASAALVATQGAATASRLATISFNSTASIRVAATQVFLRLISRNAGSAYSISVTSNQANTAGRTSGFGVAATTFDTGRNPTGRMVVRFLRASGATYTRGSVAIGLTGQGNILRTSDSPVTINVFRRGNVTVNFNGLAVRINNTANVYKASTLTTGVNFMSAIVYATADDGSYTYNLRLSEAASFFQIGPNKGESVTQNLDNMQSDSLGQSGRLSDIDVRSAAGAQNALTVVDEALNQILLARGRIGSFQKQFLESTKSNLAVYKENYSAAESNIRDTDVASEMITFTRTQILMQSGTAMLAQANLAPQSVLQLLR